MKNSKALYVDLAGRITLKESDEEIREIALRVTEKVYGISRAAIFTSKEVNVTTENEVISNSIVSRINACEPIQYILNEADFYGRKFYVDKGVLIPRPETEELVKDILGHRPGVSENLCVVDVGTGSGCIAITLALELQNASVSATDVSATALKIAATNAKALSADISLIEHNILGDLLPWQAVDIIVSNPPYIAIGEKLTMKSSVFGYEPNLALFVPDDEPLLFYDALARNGQIALRENGMLAVEINERFGKDVAGLFAQSGYDDVCIVKDLFGKDRIVRGIKRS